MSSKEVKIEKQLSIVETDTFLKSLADALSGKPHRDLTSYGIDLQDFKKIKMDIKKESSQFNIKLKVKYGLPVHEKSMEDDIEGPLKYKTLKKEMKNTFKTLKASIETGNLPEAETVGVFLKQAELMVSYTGKGYGDEYYDEFIKLCQQFKEAFDSGEIALLLSAYNAVDARKALCHDKYD